MKIEKVNFFVVSRNLLYSNRWLCEKFTRGQAWVDLFGLAQHTDSYFVVRGIKVEIKRGQLGYSQLTLAQRWKWSRDKVRRYLKCLESDGDIRQQNNEITTIITIVNYDIWQLDNTTNKTTNQTTEKQQKNIKQDTYNNVKNDNNEKRGAFAPPSLDEVKNYCLIRKNDIDPENFIDFYEMKGWMVGKNKMKDWRAAVRTWENRDVKPKVEEKAIIPNYAKGWAK
ncbi:MAG: hypothetical protein WC223_13195 [Bacteroidales bacterium]|jgi:hypothetical protein